MKAEQAPSNQPILNNAIIQTVNPPFLTLFLLYFSKSLTICNVLQIGNSWGWKSRWTTQHKNFKEKNHIIIIIIITLYIAVQWQPIELQKLQLKKEKKESLHVNELSDVQINDRWYKKLKTPPPPQSTVPPPQSWLILSEQKKIQFVDENVFQNYPKKFWF